ncbi:MAG: hypothetical protein HOH43_19790, partial [Candidatus Latescibacteria bacterium]|nr:hypothetical protein [Candidatus Latescibacterota bacterium]
MILNSLYVWGLSLSLASGISSSQIQDVQIDKIDDVLLQSILEEEDRRPATGPVPAISRGLDSDDASIRRIAVRSLGRLERPDLSATIAEVLINDVAPTVRLEAANAMAQSVFGRDSVEVLEGLIDAFSTEPNVRVRSAIARAAGRLTLETDVQRSAVEEIITRAAGDESVSSVVDAVLGLESLLRQNKQYRPSRDATVLLEAMAFYGMNEEDPAAALTVLVRATAWKAIAVSGTATAGLVQLALSDPVPEVRRSAVTAIAPAADDVAWTEVLRLGLRDGAASVRLEALRVYGSMFRDEMGCGPAIIASSDANLHVAIRAIGLLAEECQLSDRHEDPVPLLVRLSSVLSTSDGESWQMAVHGLMSLATRAPDVAEPIAVAFASHPTWQVRMYAARAAATLRSDDLLRAMAVDPHPNVAQAALRGLSSLVGREADSLSLAALDRSDYQLVLTAARNLVGTSITGTLEKVLATLNRISTELRDTSRDPRLALLRTVGALGAAKDADKVIPYLKDFDPTIAAAAAKILSDWTGDIYVAEPQSRERPSVPSPEDLRSMAGSQVIFELTGGTSFDVRLFPYDAPTVTARFVQLVKSGYFNGLSFHRVAPNFVIQGGSPGANEFMGAERYTRDEITDRSHTRGTLGISTRGRDT